MIGRTKQKAYPGERSLRVLPGQYFDQETGLYYNWNRYYDPKIGRYVTSDPVGLEGGLNTFTYAENNVLAAYDPDGLSVIKAVKWIVKGGKRIGLIPTSTVSAKVAIRMRKAGKDVCVKGRNSREVAKEIEEAANAEKGKIVEHAKDSHKTAGNQPHFQTKGTTGHTFYTAVAAFSLTTYLGDGFVGETLDFFNPLSIGKDILDIYDDFVPDTSPSSSEICDCRK